MQGWRAFYIKWQTEMAERAVSVVELVKQSAWSCDGLKIISASNDRR